MDVLRHIFIINPEAGKLDMSVKICNEIESVCSELGIEPLVFISEYKGYEQEMTRKMCELFSNEEIRLYSVGGSGTLCRVVSGIIDFSTTQVACCPVGLTNDMLKLYSKEDRLKFRSIRNLVEGNVKKLDLMDVTGFDPIDFASFGFGNSCFSESILFQLSALIHPRLTYILGIVWDIIRNKSFYYNVDIDGRDYSGDYSMIVCFNGNCMGGNVLPVPHARPDDDQLEIVFFKKTSMLRKLSGLGHFSKGQLDRLKDCVFTAAGRNVTICCKNDFVINADGEGLSSKEGKASIRLLPSKLNFIVPEGVEFIQ